MVELSGLEVLALAKEVDLALRDSYVNNIYSLGRAQIFRLRKQGGDDVILVASPDHGVWVTSRASERMETTEFTSLLRGELERGKLLKVDQEQLDRVFVLTFAGRAERKLIVELMPPGNIVVTDEHGKILLLEKEVRSPKRRLTRGGFYKPPAQTRMDPRSLSEQKLASAARQEATAGQALGRHVALPRKYVREVLRRLGIEEGAPSESLVTSAKMAAETVKVLVREAEIRPRPCICDDSGGEELYSVEPKGLTVIARGTTMSELCDVALLPLLGALPETKDRDEVKRQEMLATIANLRSEEKRYVKAASESRQAAEKASQLPIEEALALAQGSGVVPRRRPASSSAVASLLFDEAKRLESKAVDANMAAARLEDGLPRAKVGARGHAKTIRRAKGEWYEKFRWFITSEGKLAVGGRDAQSNAILVKRHLQPGDVVYHADLFGSPFFVLKGGSAQTEGEVRETAQATVAFSSAWKTGLGSADAYWVTPEQVSTAAPSGEYLAKGSFAIRGKKNFVARNLVEVAIGVYKNGTVMAGPETAVASHCGAYVVLVPHREKGSDTAKKVRGALGKAGGPGASLDLDEVARALPPGGGKTIRRHGLEPE